MPQDAWRHRPGPGGAAIGENMLEKIKSYLTPRMVRMLAIMGVLLVLIFGYIIAAPIVTYLLMPKSAFMQVPTVSTVQAKVLPWQAQLRSVGSLHAEQGADLASEIAGLVTRIGFGAGDDVRKGTLLIQLRDDSDRAQLEALRASATLAKQSYARDAALIKTAAISQQEFDTALANYKNARAQADAQAATVEKKAIRAPYDGRVGIRQVDVGQYVGAGQVLVTLQQLDPIFVDFQVPQQQFALLKTGDKISLTTDAVIGRTFPGTIVAFDPKVDPDTRNLHVRAAVRNPGGKLLPGMFAAVIVAHGAPQTPITLPQTAIVFSPYGDTVFVVTKGKDMKGRDTLIAQQRFVTLGDTRGDQVAILSGLKPDENVVSAGQIKLKNGSPVAIDNSIHVPNDAAPTPRDQ